MTEPSTALAVRPIYASSPEFEVTATHMAREFSEASAELARLLHAARVQIERLDAAFQATCDPAYRYSRFGIDIEYSGRRRDLDVKGIAETIKEMERRAWDVLVDKLGIKNVMSLAKRRKFDEQLENGQLPPICEQTIIAILMGLAGQVQDFARDAAREVLDLLRPRGRGAEYATNSTFRVGRRVILPYRVERRYGGAGYHVPYDRQQELTAIDGVFHLLDGRGIMRENKGPLIKAIDASDVVGRGETEFFKFKCFKNRNLHLEFKRIDLVKQLNGLAVGEFALGETGE